MAPLMLLSWSCSCLLHSRSQGGQRSGRASSDTQECGSEWPNPTVCREIALAESQMRERWFAIQRRCYAAGSPVHIFAYKLKIGPMMYYPAALTAESLAGRLAEDAVIQEFAPHPSGSCIVNVGLQQDRDSHEDALNELLWTVQELGYSFVEAEITKIADRAIEMAVGGGVSGGLGTGSATRNGEAAAIGAFVGYVIGLLVGAQMEKVEVVYRAQRTGTGWHLIPVAQQRATSPRPALQAN
jgi:hypothetical protein